MSKEVSIKKNVTMNMIKHACSILFPLITFPYASRVLGTAAFGKINFSRSIINYFILLSSLGINSYAIREGARIKDRKAELEVFVSEIFSINIISSIISLFLFGILVIFWEKTHEYMSILGIQIGIILLLVMGSDWVNSIFEDFKYLTIRYIVIQIICIGLLFLLVHGPKDYLAYALILVISGYGGNLLNIFYIKRYSKRKFTLHICWKRHLLPILILFSSSIAIQIYLNADITMLGVIKDDNQTGVYSAVTKIYTMIKELINAITVVIIPRIASMIQRRKIEEIERMSSKAIEFLLTLILPLSTGLFMLSKDIIYLINGNDYLSGCYALEILALTLPFAVLSCFLANALLIPFREERKFLYITVSAAVTNILLNFIAISKWGMNGAAVTTLIAEMLVFVLTFAVARKKIHIRINVKNLIICLLGCLVIGIVCLFAQNITGHLASLVMSIAVSVFLYFFTITILGNKIFYRLARGSINK